ncbi:MAG: hypothetical protein AAFY03_13865 [Pseudomonadota bacterium]
MRRTFQIAFGALSFVPFLLCVVNLINGAGQFLPSVSVYPEIDSQLRI